LPVNQDPQTEQTVVPSKRLGICECSELVEVSVRLVGHSDSVLLFPPYPHTHVSMRVVYSHKLPDSILDGQSDKDEKGEQWVDGHLKKIRQKSN
jgi:hypothetical protein